MKRLAVIPARGGSKRIPKKNVRQFSGKPMIAHILESAKASKLFDTIHVSTEDKEVATVAKSLGFPPVFMRPSELADDFTPIIPVLKYVINKYETTGIQFDQVWLLMACAPLITAEDLKKAAAIYDKAGGKSPVLSIAEYPAPIEWAYNCLETGEMSPVNPGMFATRSQDLSKKFFDAGAFAAFPSKMIKDSIGAGSDQGFLGYILPKGMAIDIDNEEDWKFAESIFELKRNSFIDD